MRGERHGCESMLNAPVRRILLLCTLSPLAAVAGQGDALRLYAGVAYGHDDNLLRVPDDGPAFDGARADSWLQREGGVLFDQSWGRQRVSIVARLSRTTFEHFRQLDYDGKDMRAAWYWQLGDRLEGQAGTTYAQTLAPYTDVLSSERNLLRSQGRFAEGTWRFQPSWRLRTGFRRDTYEYELFTQRYNNRTEHAREVELAYLPGSGSKAGLVARRITGTYRFPRPVGDLALDGGFTQDELKARVTWRATGSSTVDAAAGYTRRAQAAPGASRDGGMTGKVKAVFEPRGRMRYEASMWRDFAPIESTVVSYTMNRGIGLGARWDVTERIRVDAGAAHERRDYNARTTPATAGAMRDAVRTRTLSATWMPRPGAEVAVGLAHEARGRSVLPGIGGFTSNAVTVSGKAQF